MGQSWKKMLSWEWALLVAGGTFVILGGLGVVSFLREIYRGGRIPAGQVAARLILPHVGLLMGLALILSAIILMRKHAVIEDRLKD